MARDAKKQSAITFEEFQQQYEHLLNDRSRSYEERCEAWKALERKHPKAFARYMLRTGFGALNEGDTVWVIIRRHSRTGYSKSLSLFTFPAPKHEASPRQACLTYHVAHLMGYTVHDYQGSQVIRTDDYAQEFVAHLSQALFGIDKANALRCEVL